jgi:kynurenine formamidase
MNSLISLHQVSHSVDLASPIDISIPINENGPKAWYVDPPVISPVMENGFVGAVAQGGSVNFRNICFNPHGHGTHTECYGHIAPEVHSVNQHLNEFFFWSELKSAVPTQIGEDLVITHETVSKWKISEGVKALVIRTLPNEKNKLNKVYSATNPPYFEPIAIKWMVDKGIEHLLIDLPSVDKEVDNGKLAGHHIFWNYPNNPRKKSTITEFIFVPNYVLDGLYLLNLQVAAIENDAAPSRPLMYVVKS